MFSKVKVKKIVSNHFFQLLLLFFLLISIRFYPLIFQNKTLFFGDNYSLMVPGKMFTASWLKKGVLPLWNPNILGGVPWIGDVNQSVLYPSTLLFMFLQPGTALNLTVLSHLFISMLGMYLLVKSLKISSKQKENHFLALLAGSMWIFSTQFTNAINNITVLQSLTWMPYIVYWALQIHNSKKVDDGGKFKRFFQKNVKFLFALFVFLQFLGGYPPLVIYSIITGVIFSAFFYFQDSSISQISKVRYSHFSSFKHWLKHWLLVAVLTIVLSAVIWMPFLETLRSSTRMIQTETQATSGSLHPPEIIKFFIPYFFDHAGEGMRWGPGWNSLPNVAAYFTWFVLLAIFLSLFKKKTQASATKKDRTIKFFMIFSLATLLLSFGKYLPGFAVIQVILPIFKFARGPSLLLVITTFIVCVWIAFIFPKIKISKKWLRFLVSGSLLILIVSLIFYYVTKFNFSLIWQLMNNLTKNAFMKSAFHTLEKDQIIATVILQNLIVNSFLFFVSLILWQKGAKLSGSKKTKNVKTLLLIIILSLDLIYNSTSCLFFAPKDIYPSWAELEFAEQKTMDKIIGHNLSTNKALEQGQLSLLSLNGLQNPNYRFLIRNYNYPYTDFGAYWEALSVRKPFSDSYIDDFELKNFRNLKRFADGLTPDWNMAYGVASINAYTTLMPQDTYKEWTNYYLNISEDCKNSEINNATEEDRQIAIVSRIRCLPKEISINSLPEIQLDDPRSRDLLKKWAVKYYLVDNWFLVSEDLSSYPVVAEYPARQDSWTVYELEALARFRYEDDSGVFKKAFEQVSKNPEEFGKNSENNLQKSLVNDLDKNSSHQEVLVETPNQILLQFNNTAGHKELVIADRFDPNWRVWVNGKEVEVEEYEGMRKVEIEEGENFVKLKYGSKMFNWGAIISLLVLILTFLLISIRKIFLEDEVRKKLMEVGLLS